MNVYQVLAEGVLAIHLLWIIWAIFGWLVTARRPVLRWLHILSLLYSILIETLPWPPCPLTMAEQRLESLAGIRPYREPFLVHYLVAAVYPDVSPRLLTVCALAVCLFNLGLYVFRWRERARPAQCGFERATSGLEQHGAAPASQKDD